MHKPWKRILIRRCSHFTNGVPIAHFGYIYGDEIRRTDGERPWKWYCTNPPHVMGVAGSAHSQKGAFYSAYLHYLKYHSANFGTPKKGEVGYRA